MNEFRVFQLSFAAFFVISNLKVGLFIVLVGDFDISIIIFNKFSGNQQFLAKIGATIGAEWKKVFGYLLMISFVVLLGLGIGSPGGVNMGSKEFGFWT